MSNKPKQNDITTMIQDLSNKADQAEGYQKILSSFCKLEFGYSLPELHTILQKYDAMKKQQERVNERRVVADNQNTSGIAGGSPNNNPQG